MSKTYDSIQTITVSNNTTTSVNFTSIPQTYTDLKLVCAFSYFNTGLGGSDGFFLRINSNATASRYRYTGVRYGIESSMTAYRGNGDVPYLYCNVSATSDKMSLVVVDFSDYTRTGSKGVSLSGISFPGTGTAGQSHAVSTFSGGAYREGTTTSAITSINVITSAYAFQANSYFTLYGLLGS